jgi:pimeloyl-ACP methyl ester carboxylesterase
MKRLHRTLMSIFASMFMLPTHALTTGLNEGWQNVDGLNLFFREGGEADVPTIVFLHGYPLSSFMYAQVMHDLLELRGGRIHVIAVDYPGFGFSDAPDHRTWAYTFDHVASIVHDFLEARGIRRYSLYMQDYGVPVGFRLIADKPSAIDAIIVQNGVIHLDGFPAAQDPKGELRQHWIDRNAALDLRRTAYARSLSVPHSGWVDEDRIGPDASLLMVQSTQRPGVFEARNDLWFDYGSNVAHYPAWQTMLRKMDMPVMVLWGSHDDYFTVPGAVAYLRDAPHAEIHILDADHFATLQKPHQIAQLISDFIDDHPDAFSGSGSNPPVARSRSRDRH